MREQWIKWEPINNLADKYYIESVSESLEGFSLVLFQPKNEQEKVVIKFANSVDSFRRTTETFTYLTIDTLDDAYGSDFYGRWTFFKIKNSEYLQWLSRQSYKISEERNFTHFCFLAVDSVVDVIANYEPEVIHVCKDA